MKDWLNRLMDSDSSPSSTTLICLMAGISGVLIAIISSFFEVSNGVELSKYLVAVGTGGKVLQGWGKNKEKKNE